MRHRSPPRLTIDDLPRPVLPPPNDSKSSAPPVVVACWCGLVERMDRKRLDAFTRDIWPVVPMVPASLPPHARETRTNC